MPERDDVIAAVGDQTITLSQIDVMINSSGMVGIPLPPPATAARNQLRLALLDKAISANLLFLDAVKRGLDRDPLYRHEIERYTETMLVELYRNKVLIGEIPVRDEEVLEYFRKKAVPGSTFTKDFGDAIRASIKKQRYQAKAAAIREKVREGIAIVITEQALDPSLDRRRSPDAVVAEIDHKPISWKMFESSALGASMPADADERLEQLNRFIDRRLMLEKARAAGLDRDSAYTKRLDEFKKVHLIALHKGRLAADLEPDESEIVEFFKAHRSAISIDEARKIQMIVLKTRTEAERVKQRIESGDITIYEAAAQYSIDPNAKKTLGEMGWVEKGSGFPDLDGLTFSLPLNQLGGPVASPAGWHLVKVLDIREPRFQAIDDPATRRKVRRMLLREKRNRYVIDLRRTAFPVQVYQDVFNRLLEKELQSLNPSGGKSVPSAS